MLKNLLQTKKHLYSLIPFLQKQKFPGELGLLRMTELLQRLGNPEQDFISVHIAGTAGKGSTTYLIAKIMEQSGLKVGLHISPHLQTMRERIQVDGKLITKKEFIGLINQIKSIVEQMDRVSKFGKPSYFEVLLAATFLYFRQKKIDLAVVEAGMGGKYDGTNILKPAVTVVTNIGLDHVKVLGRTKADILKDKMRIIKPGCGAAISGIKQEYLLEIIKSHCQREKVPLLVFNKDFRVEKKYSDQKYSQFDFVFKKRVIKDIKLNLPGLFQIDNASLAIASSLKLAELSGFKLTKVEIKKALSKAFFPGRMERARDKPLVILDGAHNGDKIRALVRSIKQIYPKKKFLIVFAVKKGKDVKVMLSNLKTISNQFILTQFGQATDLGLELNYPVTQLFQKAKKIMPQAELYLEKNSQEALEKAIKLAQEKKESVLLTGSLYLVGEAREFFNFTPNHNPLTL